MASNTLFTDLPTELHQHIGAHLQFHDRHNLRRTCRTLSDRLPLFTPLDLNEAEIRNKNYAARNDLWPCYECNRIRPAHHFTDTSRKLAKGRGSSNCAGRFCLDCGCTAFHQGSGGGVRYHPGSRLTVMKTLCVVCPNCGLIKACGEFEGVRANVCYVCYEPTVNFKRGLKMRALEDEEAKERAKRRALQAERHERYKEMMGSDTDFSDDIPASPTGSEKWWDYYYWQVMADDDGMLSPRPGSE